MLLGTYQLSSMKIINDRYLNNNINLGLQHAHILLYLFKTFAPKDLFNCVSFPLKSMLDQFNV